MHVFLVSEIGWRKGKHLFRLAVIDISDVLIGMIRRKVVRTVCLYRLCKIRIGIQNHGLIVRDGMKREFLVGCKNFIQLP